MDNSMRYTPLHRHAYQNLACMPSRSSPSFIAAATAPSAVESTESQELFSKALKLDRFTDRKYVEKMRLEAAKLRGRKSAERMALEKEVGKAAASKLRERRSRVSRKSHGTAAVKENETGALHERLYANHAKTYTLDLATFCNPAEPEWFAVRVIDPEPRQANKVAKFLKGIGVILPPLKLPSGEEVSREIEVWNPKKKIKAFSVKAKKMGTKMVTYKEGMFVLFKAIMDNQLAAALQPYFQEETGFHWQELLKMPRPPLMTDFVNGQRYDKYFVPQPCPVEFLKEVQEWTEAPEVWSEAESVIEEFGHIPGNYQWVTQPSQEEAEVLADAADLSQSTAAATADTVPQQQGSSAGGILGKEQKGVAGASREASRNGAAAEAASEAPAAPFQDLPEGIPDHAMGFKKLASEEELRQQLRELEAVQGSAWNVGAVDSTRSHQYAGRSVKLSGVPRRRTEQRGSSHGSQVPYRRPRSLEEQAADLEFEDISDWKVGGVDPTQPWQTGGDTRKARRPSYRAGEPGIADDRSRPRRGAAAPGLAGGESRLSERALRRASRHSEQRGDADGSGWFQGGQDDGWPAEEDDGWYGNGGGDGSVATAAWRAGTFKPADRPPRPADSAPRQQGDAAPREPARSPEKAEDELWPEVGAKEPDEEDRLWAVWRRDSEQSASSGSWQQSGWYEGSTAAGSGDTSDAWYSAAAATRDQYSRRGTESPGWYTAPSPEGPDEPAATAAARRPARAKPDARRSKQPSRDAASPESTMRSPVQEQKRTGSKDDDDDELDW